jgi:hypothetical protein
MLPGGMPPVEEPLPGSRCGLRHIDRAKAINKAKHIIPPKMATAAWAI